MEVTTDFEYAVRTEKLRRIFQVGGKNEPPVVALDSVDLGIIKGEYLSIMGPSGSGKSTLFNAIGGLDTPTSGRVYIGKIDMSDLDASELAWLRCNRFGFIFQTFNLIPVMTALENVTLPMFFAGKSEKEAEIKGLELLRMVGLEDRVGHKPTELSGGQQQRVAIARSLANDPTIILADEPTGNLDRKTGEAIISMLKDMNKTFGVTIITATHDEKMLIASDRVVRFRDGRIERIDLQSDLNIQLGTMEGE